MASSTRRRPTPPPPSPPPATEPPAPSPETLEPIQAPYISGASVAIQGTGNEFLILIQRARPVIEKATLSIGQFALNETAGIVSLSPNAAKDLLIALQDVIGQYEKDFGIISTPFVKRRAQSGQS